MEQEKETMENTHNPLNLLTLNQNIPFMLIDFYKIDNNIR
jgi:hypothetical protein